MVACSVYKKLQESSRNLENETGLIVIQTQAPRLPLCSKVKGRLTPQRNHRSTWEPQNTWLVGGGGSWRKLYLSQRMLAGREGMRD